MDDQRLEHHKAGYSHGDGAGRILLSCRITKQRSVRVVRVITCITRSTSALCITLKQPAIGESIKYCCRSDLTAFDANAKCRDPTCDNGDLRHMRLPIKLTMLRIDARLVVDVVLRLLTDLALHHRREPQDFQDCETVPAAVHQPL